MEKSLRRKLEALCQEDCRLPEPIDCVYSAVPLLNSEPTR